MNSGPEDDVRRQHLVSKVLLKRWTIDGRILAFNLETGSFRARSPKAEGYEEHFIVHGSGQTEARWREFEDRAHRALCAVEDGTLPSDPTNVDAIKGLIGLHLVRSRVATVMWERALHRQGDPEDPSHLDQLRALVDSPEVQDAVFEHLTGLEPAGPGARAHARAQLVEQLNQRLAAGGEAFRDLLVENVGRFMRDFAKHDVEIGVSDAELLIGDVPALTVDHASRSAGFLAGVTLQSQEARPDAAIVPVLICRRHHITTQWMAKQLGFFVIAAKAQFIDWPDDDERLLEEVREELGYLDLVNTNAANDEIRGYISRGLPKIIATSFQRWQHFGPQLKPFFDALRREVQQPSRAHLMRDLRSAAKALGADGGW